MIPARRHPDLSRGALSAVDTRRVAPPSYDLDAVEVGVAHIGIGAFHRAHQAAYFDSLLAQDRRWGVCATSLHSASTARGLQAQDGLYTLALLDDPPRDRIIGAMREPSAPGDPAFSARLVAASTRLVTLTITEKGYCRAADGPLDFTHPGVRADLAAGSDAPAEQAATAIGLLVRALKARRKAGIGGLDVLSCDNLMSNGDALRAAVLAFAAEDDPDLASWIAGEVRFPNAMVDSITPAADGALIDAVTARTGVRDAFPVQREPFSAWVISREVGAGFPDLEAVGVTMTSDVAAHERAKLRLLNGAHSTLAYLGLACGFETVAEAMASPPMARFLSRLMTCEIAPSLAEAPGLDLAAYQRALLSRFANPCIAHRLSQIAWDGSQKLPIRLLATVADNLAAGRPVWRLGVGVAAWMRFVARAARGGVRITDPLADALTASLRSQPGRPEDDVAALLARRDVFPATLALAPRFSRAVEAGYRHVVAIEHEGPARLDADLSPTGRHDGVSEVRP